MSLSGRELLGASRSLVSRRKFALSEHYRAMHDVADQRGVEFEWGTRFLLSTFKECGIEEGELDQGVDEYSQDLGLPESVVAEINDSSK